MVTGLNIVAMLQKQQTVFNKILEKQGAFEERQNKLEEKLNDVENQLHTVLHLHHLTHPRGKEL